MRADPEHEIVEIYVLLEVTLQLNAPCRILRLQNI